MNNHEEFDRGASKAPRFKQNLEFKRRCFCAWRKSSQIKSSSPASRVSYVAAWVPTVSPPWENCSALSERAVRNLWLAVSSAQEKHDLLISASFFRSRFERRPGRKQWKH